MKRRKFILGTGAAAAGGASLLGSGAFTSVEADRSVSVSVASDADAFLRLAPCTDEGGNPKPNGDYVHGHADGTISIDLSSDNPNTDDNLGNGVNADARSRFDNVFEICNQGTQDVCVDFEIDVPEIPGPVPDRERYDFEEGDPAVVFYRGSSREEYISTGELNTDRPGAISLSIDGGECQCVGFEVRTFGFDSGEDIFADTDLTIRADADGDCEDGVSDPTPGYNCGVYAREVVSSDQGETNGGSDINSNRTDPANATGPPNAGSYPTDTSYDTSEIFSLGFGDDSGGSIELSFDGQIVRNDSRPDVTIYEATNGNRADYGLEKADVYVVNADGDEFKIGQATSRSEDKDSNNGISELNIDRSATGPFESIKLVDKSDSGDFNSSSDDGFDVDAVEVCVAPDR